MVECRKALPSFVCFLLVVYVVACQKRKLRNVFSFRVENWNPKSATTISDYCKGLLDSRTMGFNFVKFLLFLSSTQNSKTGEGLNSREVRSRPCLRHARELSRGMWSMDTFSNINWDAKIPCMRTIWHSKPGAECHRIVLLQAHWVGMSINKPHGGFPCRRV